MTKEELKNWLLEKNQKYRQGQEVVSDYTFDQYLEDYSKLASAKEYEELRGQLFEPAGDVKHKYIVGSLEKFTAEEGNAIRDWAGKDSFCVTPKIDGCSMTLTYQDGVLTNAITRGDAFVGREQYNKIRHIVPNYISNNESEVIIRGEVVILKEDFAKAEAEMHKPLKNRRNATTGILNALAPTIDLVQCLTFVPFKIWGSDSIQPDDIVKFQNWGMYKKAFGDGVLPQINFDSGFQDFTGEGISEILSNVCMQWMEQMPFDMDGLVMRDCSVGFENVKIPERVRAFKINQLIAESEITNIIYQVSKSGYLCPVAEFDPVMLGGAIVSRCTLFHAGVVRDNMLTKGTRIRIVKAGDIIPYFKEVVDREHEITPSCLPSGCPCCFHALKEIVSNKTLELKCTNPNCPDQLYKKMVFFLRNLGIEIVTEVSLENWGIKNWGNLIRFKPKDSVNQIKFKKALDEKMFTATKEELLESLDWDGVSIKTWRKIWQSGLTIDDLDDWNIKEFKYDRVENALKTINGIGDKIIKTIVESYESNRNIVSDIVTEPNYQPKVKETKLTLQGITKFCFTGALSHPRSYYKNLINQHVGMEISDSVTKDLSFLVTNDKDSNSSKAKKAQQLGISIINEEEFLSLIAKFISR